MSFTALQEDYIFNPVPCYEYEVRGTSEYNIADNHTENHFRSLVYCKENENKLVDFKITHFSQTSKALIYQIAQDFSTAISNLLIQLNTKGQVIKICNLEDIQSKFQESKTAILEKYSNVPDIDNIIKNYEVNIQQEQKLRKSLFYYGINRIFFTGIKELIQRTLPKKQTTRTRKFDAYILSFDLPVMEDITIEQINGTYKVNINGKPNTEQVDKNKFLEACRIMYGKDIELSDISFEIQETYELDNKLKPLKGFYSHTFKIRAKQLKKDILNYHLKQHSFV